MPPVMKNETELEMSLRMIWIGRLLLLQAGTDAAVLYAQALWRMAELRYVVYQIALGDVVVNRTDTTIAATVRAAEQMIDKLETQSGLSLGKAGIYADSSDTLVVLLDLLSRQLSHCVLEPHKDNFVTKRTVTRNTVLDWYVKLTFIVKTLEKSSVIMKVTTLGFPDIKPTLPEANYVLFAKTHILTSLKVMRVEKEDSGTLLELRDVGELIAVAAAGKLDETKTLRLPPSDKVVPAAVRMTESIVQPGQDAKNAALVPTESKTKTEQEPARKEPTKVPVQIPTRSYAAVVKGC